MKKKKFTVIGAGNGGKAMAAYLAIAGQDVTLFNRTFHHIEVIAKRGGIDLESPPGGPHGFGALKKVTDDVQEALQKRVMLYDRNGEEHFNLISALHKSLRNSDVNASLYWLARMIVSGEDCMYIARRLVRFASEDIGLADNQALTVALNAKDAYHFLGSPEGELALAQAAVYLASAPKSNRVYKALDRAVEDVKSHLFKPVPLHLRNPVTSLMKEKGYGKDYKYAHDYSEATTNMETMPEGLRNRNYYEPGSMGFEKEIKKRIEWWQSIKEKIRDKK